MSVRSRLHTGRPVVDLSHDQSGGGGWDLPHGTSLMPTAAAAR